MKIAAFTRYGGDAASTRQRLTQYIPALHAAGFEVEAKTLLDNAYVRAIATGRTGSRLATARSYLERFSQVHQAKQNADLIWIYAELFPFLPALVERQVFRRGLPVVYDFDDAFFLAYNDRNPILRGVLQGKHAKLLKRAAAVFCGNAYLFEFARQHCDNAIYLPTVVDTTVYAPRPRRSESEAPVVIGWIGSPSTWRYVLPIVPMLERLAHEIPITLRIVGAGAAASAATRAFARSHNIEWTLAGEVADIQDMDIGIMPAVDEPWALGKCGYKLIQYMACGLPVVASPIGAANDIVKHGINGFLAEGDDQWEAALRALVADAAMRTSFGRAGRARVESDYSLAIHAPRLVGELTALLR